MAELFDRIELTGLRKALESQEQNRTTNRTTVRGRFTPAPWMIYTGRTKC